MTARCRFNILDIVGGNLNYFCNVDEVDTVSEYPFENLVRRLRDASDEMDEMTDKLKVIDSQTSSLNFG